MELLYVFMSSSKAHALYLKKQVELHPAKQTRQLQRFSDTRWACRYFAIDAVAAHISIIATLVVVMIEVKQLRPKGFFIRLNVSSSFTFSNIFSDSIFY